MTSDVDRAVAVLRAGGVVVYPTDTLWGLGARIDNEAAVRRVFAIKQRPLHEPLSVAVPTTQAIDRLAVVTPLAQRLFKLLPGPLTVVLESRSAVPSIVTAGQPSVGIRVPDHPLALDLLARAGPLTATSANVHGEPDPVALDGVRGALGDRVDYYLAASSPRQGRASTLVDARGAAPIILRPGVISEQRIRECLAQ